MGLQARVGRKRKVSAERKRKNGAPQILLWPADDFFTAMRNAGYDDVERGECGRGISYGNAVQGGKGAGTFIRHYWTNRAERTAGGLY